MAHKTLIGGTAYTVTGGTSMVSGSTYKINQGTALIDGTKYYINFKDDKTYAMFYDNGDLVFQYGSAVEEGKTLVNKWYQDFNNIQSFKVPSNVINVSFKNEFSLTNISNWFSSRFILKNFNIENLP